MQKTAHKTQQRKKKIEGIARDKWASLIAFPAIDKGICSMLAVIKYELAANGESRMSKQPPGAELKKETRRSRQTMC